MEKVRTADFIQIMNTYCNPLRIKQYLVMRSTYTAVLLGLLVFCGAAVDCPVEHSTQVFSDSVGLSSQFSSESNAQNLVFNYQYGNSWSETPDVAIGINEIQSNESPYLELHISAARVTPNEIYFQAKSGQLSQWKSFQVNFLATTRNDIEIGTATVSNPLTNRDGAFDIAYNLQNEQNKSGMRIKSFMQGVNLQSVDKQQIGLQQKTTNVIGQTIYFTFSNIERKSIVRSLTLSIIVFNIDTPGILYADGIIDQNYVISTTQVTIPKHGINELRTYIVGINSFETSAAAPISISSAIDETFTLVIGPIDRNEIDFISVSYLILSVVDCGSCAGFPLLFDGLCKRSCPNGLVPQNGRCVSIECSEGFILKDQNCVPQCRENQIYSKGVCTCIEGYYFINGNCTKCAEDEYFDYKEVKCKPYCTFNSYYLGGRCYCNDGYNIINGLCQKCPYGSIYNQRTQKCDDICTGAYEIYSPNGCVCRNGYDKIDGVCGRCPYRRIYNPITQSCDCLPGEQFVGNMCMPFCAKNQTRKADGTCDCAEGFLRMFNGHCMKCPENAYYVAKTQECMCNIPYMMMNGVCVPICKKNYAFNQTTKQCYPLCQQYLEDFINGQCVCTKGYERFRNGTCIPTCGSLERRIFDRCDCIDGYTKDAIGRCVLINCPAGTAWNNIRKDCVSICNVNQIFINGQCQCIPGYANDNKYGECIPQCSQFEIRVNGFCECPPNHIRVAYGMCVPQCPPGSVGQGGRCVCKDNCKTWGFNGLVKSCSGGMTYDPITDSCRCKAPQVWVLGRCQTPNPCGNLEYWCGTSCVCNHGYYRVNGQCVPVPAPETCPANSVTNGVNCQCLPGYYPITPGTCSQCPTGTHWNGQRCAIGDYECSGGYKWDVTLRTCVLIVPLCNPNEYWDGITCRCQQGFFPINFECKPCLPGTFFDGNSCVTGNGPQCNDPYSFFNGISCVCLPGFWPLVDGRCITCPAGTIWGGTCCVVQPGVTLPITVI